MIPSILVLTPGHAGSSIVTWMLGQIGWHLPADADEFAESPQVRRVNAMFRRGELDAGRQAAERYLTALRVPWILKDPRFCDTLLHWQPLFGDQVPFLLHLTRDTQLLRESRQRRGRHPGEADRRVRLCVELLRQWPGRSLTIDFDRLRMAFAGWSSSRVGRGADGHGIPDETKGR